MLTSVVNRDPRLSRWLRVREFAVPPSMIETATTRRHTGDWAGACAAAGLDVDLDLRTLARDHGRELTAQVRCDLRHLAPDLLRWHMPRIAPDGLLRPGVTVALARYGGPEHEGAVHLVVRTPPAWADAGQRISLALWDPSRTEPSARRHPHPHPDRRHRFDLHRHLWDDRRTGELRARCGADRRFTDRGPSFVPDPGVADLLPPGCAVGRWAAEAEILLRAGGRTAGPGREGAVRADGVTVRLAGHRLLLEPPQEWGAANSGFEQSTWRLTRQPPGGGDSFALPVLPDAATWLPPDVELLDAGLIDAAALHPLVASALAPDARSSAAPKADAPVADAGPPGVPPPGTPPSPHLVECRGERHRIGLVDGVLAPLDHPVDVVRREELLAALTGTPLPCLQAIDDAHRHPECLTGVRERLDHGDIAGALAVVEGLLGPDALLRDGALRDELESAAERRLTYGLFRAGLIGGAPAPPAGSRPRRQNRSHPRQANFV